MLAGFPSSLLDRFEPTAALGAGSFGAVFAARDRRLERTVAIKVLHPHADPEVLRRFEREAAVLARLRHPNIVEVFAAGVAGGHPYLVMELLEGTSLERAGVVDDPLEAMLAVAEALDAVHAQDLLHRDVKPANILRTPQGRVVLADFGLVHDPTHTRLTKTGAVVGTILFLAPELFTGGSASPATDWYAWGVSLYVLLEGGPPWANPLPHLLRGKPLPPPDFPRSGAQAPAARLVRATLERDPDRRPGSTAALRHLLGQGPGTPAGPAARRPSIPLASSAPGAAPPRRGGRVAPALAALALALAGLAGYTLRPGAPPLAPAVPAAPPAPEQAALLEAASRLAGGHRSPGGGFRFAHRVGVLDDHVHEIYPEVADGRQLARWRRFSLALLAWLPVAPAATREAVLRHEVYPRLAHLQYDETALRNKAENPAIYATVSRPELAQSFDYPLLKRRLDELETERTGHLAALVPALETPAGCMVELMLIAFGDHPARARAAAHWRAQLAAESSPDERMELAFAARTLFAYGRRGPRELTCDEADALLDERFQVLHREGPRASPTQRARLEAALLWVYFEQLSTCRKELSRSEEQKLLRMIDGVSAMLVEGATEDPDMTARDTAAAAIQGINLFYTLLAQHTLPLSQPTRDALARSGELLDQLRVRQGGRPRRRVALMNTTLGGLLAR